VAKGKRFFGKIFFTKFYFTRKIILQQSEQTSFLNRSRFESSAQFGLLSCNDSTLIGALKDPQHNRTHRSEIPKIQRDIVFHF
jgi:hypothetical protein